MPIIHTALCIGYSAHMEMKELDALLTPDAIGERLALLREVEGLSQAAFAERAGISYQAWNNWERGRARIGIDAAARLCAVYNVTLDYIYFGDPSALPYRLAHAIAALRSARDKR